MTKLRNNKYGQSVLEYTAFSLAIGIAIAFFGTYSAKVLKYKIIQIENETKKMPEAGTCNPGVGNCD